MPFFVHHPRRSLFCARTHDPYAQDSQTSVSGACFRGLGRKFYSLYSCRLPYQGPVFGDWDGSFSHCTLADFRIRGLFSGIGTEVGLQNYYYYCDGDLEKQGQNGKDIIFMSYESFRTAVFKGGTGKKCRGTKIVLRMSDRGRFRFDFFNWIF